MKWELKVFEALTLTELYAIMQLRSMVFVVEQNCPYLDLDNDDQKSFHYFSPAENGDIIAYCRIVPPNLHYTEPSIGRVITHPNYRKTGSGKILMQNAIEITKNNYPNCGIKIGAQLYLKQFYESFGFVQVSEIYLEDNIEHIKMLMQ